MYGTEYIRHHIWTVGLRRGVFSKRMRFFHIKLYLNISWIHADFWKKGDSMYSARNLWWTNNVRLFRHTCADTWKPVQLMHTYLSANSLYWRVTVHPVHNISIWFTLNCFFFLFTLKLSWIFQIPKWACFLAAFGVFSYHTLDVLDGKQAVRIGRTSPLGELLDHGCDAMSIGKIKKEIPPPTFVCKIAWIGPNFRWEKDILVG